MRRTSWLAILAMLLNAFWPLIATARAPGISPPIEICTPQGIATIAGDPAPAPDPHDVKHPQSHCPLCGGTDKFVALAAVPSHGPRAESAARIAIPAGASQHSRDERRSPAHPRAPPVLS